MGEARRFEAAERAVRSGVAELATAARDALAALPEAVLLVEGASDKIALEALAERRRRDLGAEGIAIVPIGGATKIGGFLDLFGPPGLDVRLAGLCDAAEEGAFQRGLQRVGLGFELDRAAMERLGFFVCVADLEYELIRALGNDAVLRVVEAHGEGARFSAFQRQPAWRGRDEQEQLWRFVRSHSVKTPNGGPAPYVRLLVEALDLTRVPRPLDRVLSHF